MTRINCIPVQELTNKHLVAEYRELPRVAKMAHKAFLRSPTTYYNDATAKYTLGKGHVKFFYKKGLWLYQRHKELVREMKKRSFTVNYPDYPIHYHAPSQREDWQPTPEDMELNRQRIRDRLSNMEKDKK